MLQDWILLLLQVVVAYAKYDYKKTAGQKQRNVRLLNYQKLCVYGSCIITFQISKRSTCDGILD